LLKIEPLVPFYTQAGARNAFPVVVGQSLEGNTLLSSLLVEEMHMKRWTSLVVAFALALPSTQALAQNLLENPSFEDPTVDLGSANDVWFRFGAGGGSGASESTVAPRTGSRHIELTTVTNNQFAGVFQNINQTINPGDIIQFTGFHKNVGDPFDATIELKLEWQGTPNPPQNRLDVLTLGTAYEQFTHTGTAPSGTTGLVITYAISSFGPGGAGTSTVHIDDFQAIIVPEPATCGTLALGLLGLAGLRRRR
jgi:hypothetical protein